MKEIIALILLAVALMIVMSGWQLDKRELKVKAKTIDDLRKKNGKLHAMVHDRRNQPSNDWPEVSESLKMLMDVLRAVCELSKRFKTDLNNVTIEQMDEDYPVLFCRIGKVALAYDLRSKVTTMIPVYDPTSSLTAAAESIAEIKGFYAKLPIDAVPSTQAMVVGEPDPQIVKKLQKLYSRIPE